MDTSLVMYFFTLLAVSIGVLCIIYYLIGKNKNHFFLVFALGKFLQGIGVGTLAITGPEKILETVSFSAITIMTGFALEIFTFTSYDEIFKRGRFRFIALFLSLGILGVLFTSSISLPVQIGIFGIVNATLFGYASLKLLQERRNSVMAFIAGCSFLIYTIIWILSAFHAFSSGPEFKLTDTSNPAHLVISIFTVFNFVVGSVGYLIAQKELAEIRIREQVKQIASDNELLSELIETKNRFFSIIAHDLRGPIGAMSQIGELLSEENAPEEREEMIRLITDTSKSSFILLENLLFWARSESGALEMRPVKERLRTILDQSIHVLNGNLIRKKQHLAVHCPEWLCLKI